MKGTSNVGPDIYNGATKMTVNQGHIRKVLKWVALFLYMHDYVTPLDSPSQSTLAHCILGLFVVTKWQPLMNLDGYFHTSLPKSAINLIVHITQLNQTQE